MAGIRALYEEVGELLAVVIQLHQELLACHQAQKDREAQMQTGIASLGELVTRGLLARDYIEDLEAEIKQLRNSVLAMVFVLCVTAGLISAVSVVLMFRAGWLGR